MNTLKNYMSFFLLLLILLVIFGGVILIAVSLVAALIVPLTYVWGLITDQSYDRVCDNSEIIYRLNQIGKWSLVVYSGIFILWIISLFI